MLSMNLHVYQIRLDWLALPCIALDLTQPGKLPWCLSGQSTYLVSSLSWFESHLSSSFSLEKGMIWLVVLPYFLGLTVSVYAKVTAMFTS